MQADTKHCCPLVSGICQGTETEQRRERLRGVLSTLFPLFFVTMCERRPLRVPDKPGSLRPERAGRLPRMSQPVRAQPRPIFPTSSVTSLPSP